MIRLVPVVLLCTALSACGGEAGPAAQGQAATPSAASEELVSADPADLAAQQAATQTATAFLAALVAEDHNAAFALLSPAAQAGTTLDAFAAARKAKANSARSLGQKYELTGMTGGPAGVTVTGDGRLADGTTAAIALPLVADGAGWRVDAVPTAF